MEPDPPRSALTVEDQFLLRIAQKNGILSAEQIGLATSVLVSGGERLEQVLLRLGLLDERQLGRLREAMAASQVVRLDALYAAIIAESGLLPQSIVEQAFAEQRRQKFRVRLGNILLERRAINPAMHRKIISAVIKRLRAEGNDAYASTVGPPPPPLPSPSDSDHVTEPLQAPPLTPSGRVDPFATGNAGLSPLQNTRPAPGPGAPIPPTHPPDRPPLALAETRQLGPSLFAESDGHYRAMLEDLKPADALEPETDSFVVSAIQIGLDTDDSLPFKRSDQRRLETDLLESKELPEDNFVLDRLEIASGESTEFLPDEYLERKRVRTRMLQVGGVVVALVVLLVGGGLLSRVVSNRSSLGDIRALLAQAEALSDPSKRLPLLRKADGVLAGIQGPGVGEAVRSELEQQLRWGVLRAEALEILAAGDPGGAKTLLETRAAHVPAFAKAEHAELLKRTEREAQLGEARAAEEQSDIPRAVLAYRRALAQGDPGGRATERLAAIRGTLVSAMNEAYAVALETLSRQDEDTFFDAAKLIHDLFNEDAGANARIEEIRFRRAMRAGRRALERGELESAKAKFEIARKLRPTDRSARDAVARAQSRAAQRSDEERGREADARKDYEAAIAAYERAKRSAEPEDHPRLDAAIAKSRRNLQIAKELLRRRRQRREALALLRESKTEEAVAALEALAAAGKDPKTELLLSFARTVDGMVYVAPGAFLMGSKQDPDARAIELPQRTVELPGFFISRTEVTNESYAAFLEATGAQGPSHWSYPLRQRDGSVRQTFDPAIARHPVVSITWSEARAFAQWRGGDLPSEAQWEKAARGTDGRRFPWGSKQPVRAHIEIRPSRLRAHKTSAVGAHADDRSPCGAMDMAGNVNEWTLDLLVPYPGAPKDAKPSKGRRTIRGGAYRWPYVDARCAARDSMQETYRSPTVGFRVVIDVPETIPPLR